VCHLWLPLSVGRSQKPLQLQLETTGSGDLAIPALRIGCVPAGSSAANNRGEKNLVIDLIEGLAIFDVPSNLRSG